MFRAKEYAVFLYNSRCGIRISRTSLLEKSSNSLPVSRKSFTRSPCGASCHVCNKRCLKADASLKKFPLFNLIWNHVPWFWLTWLNLVIYKYLILLVGSLSSTELLIFSSVLFLVFLNPIACNMLYLCLCNFIYFSSIQLLIIFMFYIVSKLLLSNLFRHKLEKCMYVIFEKLDYIISPYTTDVTHIS